MNRRFLVRTYFVSVLLVSFAFAASDLSAEDIKWTLQTQTATGMILPYIPLNGDSVARAAGSFTYDVDTNTFSSIDITLTVPVAFLNQVDQLPLCSNEPQLCGTFHLTSLGPPGFPSNDDVFQFSTTPSGADLTGVIFLSGQVSTGQIVSQMTDLGGTLILAGLVAGVCSADCINGDVGSGADTITSLPEITTTPASSVPEPPAAALVGIGLTAIVWLVRRRGPGMSPRAAI